MNIWGSYGVVPKGQGYKILHITVKQFVVLSGRDTLPEEGRQRYLTQSVTTDGVLVHSTSRLSRLMFPSLILSTRLLYGVKGLPIRLRISSCSHLMAC